MERIYYAGDSVLTGTEIAQALVAYAEALAMREASATVNIPVRLSDGSVGRASILIGPASQLISQTEVGAGEEMVDDDLVAEFRDLAGRLGVSRPMTADPDEPATYDDIDDLDIPDHDSDADGRGKDDR
jgi:hypothetical protein